MATPVLLQNNFSLGMKQDQARNRQPLNTLWNAVDVILNYGAALRQRGGWSYQSQDIASITSTAASIRGGIYAIFSTTAGGELARNIAIDEDGYVYDATIAGSASGIGAGVQIAQNPIYHGGTAVTAATPVFTGIVIIPDATGANVPKKYDGTTLGNLNGTPPKARYAGVYKDYTILANGTVGSTYYPNRIWFSPPGDPDVAVSGAVTAWDTENSWIDFSLPVRGFGPLKNACLIFHEEQISRVRGSVPPPDEDMVVDDPLFNIGLLDTFSISTYKDNVYWCAPEGVFRSDGVIIDDLTKKGGMLRYWLDLIDDATATWTFSTGVQRDTLFITVMDGATFKDAFMVDLQSLAWTRLSNIDALSLWTGMYAKSDELYWGRKNAARVCRLSTIFNVGSSTYKTDGDGDAVLPVVETAFYEVGRPGLKRFRRLFVGADVHDYATDDPTITVQYLTSPEATSYTTAGTVSESTAYLRSKIPLSTRGPGVGLKFTKANAGDFLLHDIGVEIITQEPSK